MNGTSWLGKISASFTETRAAWKAQPSPAALYPPQTPQANTGSYPLTWGGWEQYETQGNTSGDARNSQDLQRAKVALTSSWVFADITAIANEASISMLEIVERQQSAQEDREIVNHPLEVLWEAPNPFMGRSYLTKFWIFNLLLSGKASLFWVPGADGLAECWPIPSFMLTPIPDPKEFIRGYRFQADSASKPIFLERKYVTFSRLVHPFDLRDGLSPLAAIFDAIEADLAMRRWNKQFFAKENAAPTGLILVPKDMLDPDLARVRMEIMEFFGGASHRRVGVARAGDMDWKPFDRSQKDMEFLSGRSFSRDEIDRAFGFPEGYWSDKASRANAESAAARMIENAVWPHLVMLAEDLNAQTIPQWYGDQYRAQFSDIRPRNRQLELQELGAAQATLTIDEIRKKYWQLPPIGDERGKLLIVEVGKGAPPDDESTDPASMPPALLPEDGSNPTDADQLVPDPDALDAPDEAKALDLARWQSKALKAIKNGKSAAVRFASANIPIDDVQAISAALIDAKSVTDVHAAFIKKSDTLTPAEQSLIAALEAVFSEHADAIAQAVQSGNQPSLTQLEQQLSTALEQALIARYVEQANLISRDTGITFDPVQVQNDAAAWAQPYTPQLIAGLTDTTQTLLQRVISEARATPGMTIAQIAERLAPAFGEARADVIATTELTRAASQATVASQEYLKQAGVNTVMTWRTNNDERVCPICNPRNDTPQGSGWDEPPPAHPRCRCMVVLVRTSETKQSASDRAMFANMGSSGGGGGKGGSKPSGGTGGLWKVNPDTGKREPGQGLEKGAAPSTGQQAKDATDTKPKTKAEVIRDEEARIRKQRFESAVILDANGNILLHKDGTKDSVTFSDADMKTMRGANVTLTHNHPSGWDVPADSPQRNGTSFSREDIQLAASVQLAEMRAVTPTRTFSMKPPPGGWNDRYYRTRIAPAYERADKGTRVAFTKQMQNGSMSIAEANSRHAHTVWTQVAKELGLDYTMQEG